MKSAYDLHLEIKKHEGNIRALQKDLEQLVDEIIIAMDTDLMDENLLVKTEACKVVFCHLTEPNKIDFKELNFVDLDSIG